MGAMYKKYTLQAIAQQLTSYIYRSVVTLLQASACYKWLLLPVDWTTVLSDGSILLWCEVVIIGADAVDDNC